MLQDDTKACEFKADVLIGGKLTRRFVIGDYETLGTRRAVLKGTERRVNITKFDYKRFKEWYRTSPPDTFEVKPYGFLTKGELVAKAGRIHRSRLCSGGLPSLGKRRP